MNIIQYLEKAIIAMYGADQAKPEGLTDAEATEALSLMELHIRRGIAAELEDLVSPGVDPLPHGLPIHPATSLNCTISIPPSLFYKVQQEFFRAAALTIQGKAKATPDDWHIQAEAMRRRSVSTKVEQLRELMDGAQTVGEQKAQLAFEAAEERKRERSE